MASHKASPRRLFEMLEEQQDPFLLGIYLVDSEYSETTIEAKASFICWSPKIQCHRSKKGGDLRCHPPKLGCWEFMKRALNWKHKAQHCRRLGLCDFLHEVRSKRYIFWFHRLSSSGVDGKGVLNGDDGWKDVEELSPVSVLNLNSDEGFSVDDHSMEDKNASKSSLNSLTVGASLHFAPLPLHEEANREVQRSGVTMEEKSCSLSNQWVDLARIPNLICLDLHESLREWSQFQDQRRETEMEIEVLILEELREECVLDMLGSHCALARC